MKTWEQEGYRALVELFIDQEKRRAKKEAELDEARRNNPIIKLTYTVKSLVAEKKKEEETEKKINIIF